MVQAGLRQPFAPAEHANSKTSPRAGDRNADILTTGDTGGEYETGQTVGTYLAFALLVLSAGHPVRADEYPSHHQADPAATSGRRGRPDSTWRR
jgi:hypothetical protein